MFPSPSCARKETAARTGLRSHRGRSGYRVLASPLSFNVAVARRIASFACRAGAGCPVTAEVTTLVEDRRRRLLAFRWVASLLAVFWVSFSLGLSICLSSCKEPRSTRRYCSKRVGACCSFSCRSTTGCRCHPFASGCPRRRSTDRSCRGRRRARSAVELLRQSSAYGWRPTTHDAAHCCDPAVPAQVHRQLLGLDAVGARDRGGGAMAGYASASARSGEPPQEITLGLDHWPIQSALAIAVVLVSGFAATLPSGWMTPTWTVGIAAAWSAVVAWVNPDLAASMSRLWASAALVWAVAFVIALHLSNARRSRRRNRPSNSARSP